MLSSLVNAPLADSFHVIACNVHAWDRGAARPGIARPT